MSFSVSFAHRAGAVFDNFASSSLFFVELLHDELAMADRLGNTCIGHIEGVACWLVSVRRDPISGSTTPRLVE